MQFATLAKTQDTQHTQNHALLDQIRADGQQREVRLVGMLEAFQQQNREDAREQRKRVDDVLRMLGDRRR